MMERIGRVPRIQSTVAKYYGLEADDMLSSVREKYIAHPRQVAMFLTREITHLALTDIGRRFHRHHTTVIHAIRAVERRAARQSALRKDLQKIRDRLGV